MDTYTIAGLHRRIGLLQECLEEVLFTQQEQNRSDEGMFQSYITRTEAVGSSSDASVLSKWGKTMLQEFSSATLAKQLAALREEAAQLPVLTLYVPAHLNDEAIAYLGSWCRENLKKGIMLDLHVDPAVVGGCAFVSSDTYHDCSLAHAFSQNSGVVTQLLNSYD